MSVTSTIGTLLWLVAFAMAFWIAVSLASGGKPRCTHGASSITATKGADGRYHPSKAHTERCLP